jgi:hypothetical protein
MGFFHSLHLKNNIRVVRDFIKLAERIKSRIDCFRQPLCDIYEGFSSEVLDRIGFTSDLILSGLSFALVKNRSALCISDETFELLYEFSQSLGKSYASEQVKLCSELIRSLESRLEKLENDLPSKSKLSITLCCAAAAMTAILFL